MACDGGYDELLIDAVRVMLLAAILQPDALVGLARCNRNAVPMHNQPVIDRDDTRFSCINL